MKGKQGAEMTIQARCRCGMRFTLEVHEWDGDWFMDITERDWPYRSGSACITFKDVLPERPETFLRIAATYVIPLMDEDLSRVNGEEGCQDHNIDYGEIVVERRGGRRKSHLIVPTGLQDRTYVMAGVSSGIKLESLVGCPGGLQEDSDDSEDGSEDDR